MSVPRIPRESAEQVMEGVFRRMGIEPGGDAMDRFITATEENLESLPDRFRALLAKSPSDEIVVELDIAVNLETGPRLASALTAIRSLQGGSAIRFIGTRSALRLAGVVMGEVYTGPERVQVEIINSCNLGCQYCWNNAPHVEGRRNQDWRDAQFSFGDFRRVVEDAADLDAEGIILTGRGEPALHPSSVDMCRFVKERGLHLTVQVHAASFKHADLLADAGIDRLLLNMPGVTPGAFERIHGKGSSDLFERSMANLGRLGELHRQGRIEVIPNMVITDENAADLSAAVNLFAKEGFQEAFFRALVVTPEMERTGLGYRRIKRTAQKAIEAARKESEKLGVRYGFPSTSGSKAGLFGASRKGQPCGVGWYFGRVTVEREAHFCCSEKRVESLDSGGGLKALWRSERWMKMRQAAFRQDAKSVRGFVDSDCALCMHAEQKIQILSLLGATPGR